MLSQVSKALSQIFRPVATAKSDADRDPAGNQFERFVAAEQKREEQTADENGGKKNPHRQQKAETAGSSETDQPSAQIIPFVQKTSAEAAEVQKKAIGFSQAWLGLKDLIRNSKEASAGHSQIDQQNMHEGTDAYEQTSTQSSKSNLSKKGVILDKKVG